MTENRGWPGSRAFRWSLTNSLDTHLSGTDTRQLQEDFSHVLRGLNRFYPNASNSVPGNPRPTRHLIGEQNVSASSHLQDIAIDMENIAAEESNLPTLLHSNHDQNGNTTNTSEILRQTPEIRALLSFIEQLIPFLLLLLAKLIYDHRLGILVALSLIGTFYYANQTIKKLVAAKDKRPRTTTLWIIILLAADVFFIYFVFEADGLWHCLIFIPPIITIKDLWMLVWVIGITDFVLKFATLSSKAVVVFLPAVLIPFKRRGKYYLFIEQCSQYFRCLVPIVPWFSFLLGLYYEGDKIFSTASIAIYCISKGKILWKKTKSFIHAVEKVSHSVSYGVHPTKEELIIVGSSCPICQDNFTDPIMLHCKHIFCEECVSIWFDRERTCPMCRAQIADDPAWRDGSTSAFVQLC